MKLIRDKVKEEIYMCKKLCDMAERGDLRSDYILQREPGQWENTDRDNFIVSVLLNEDFDAIKICEELTPTGVTLWIIDGLQKYTYISDFKAGKFKLGVNIDPQEITYQEAKKGKDGVIVKDEDGNIVYEEVTFKLKNKKYSDLPPKLKENFDDCPVKIVKHLDCTQEEMARHLRRYNRGAKMKPAQILLTRMLNVGKQIRDLSDHHFWSDRAVIKPSDRKNGKVNQLMAEIVMGLNFWDHWTRTAAKIGEYLNENATDEMFEDVKNMLDDFMEITTVDIGERIFSSKNILIWCMAFQRALNNGWSKNKFGKFLESFDKYSDMKIEITYNNEKFSTTWVEFDKNKSTKDRGIIEAKLHILHILMEKFIEGNGIEIESEVYIEEDTNAELSEVMEEFGMTNKNVENTTNEESLKSVAYEITNDPMETIPNDELVEFVRENTELDVDSEDISLYKVMLEGFVPITSQIYMKCYKALIALMADTCNRDKDREFEEWIQNNRYDSNNFSQNQRTNYLYLKRDFNNAIASAC